MGLASLYNVPTNDDEMAGWSANHQAEHFLINAAVLEQHNAVVPMYVLDPVNLADPQAFLNLHQQLHNIVDQILGVAPQNLTEVDWNDPGEREGWIALNAQLHVAESNALEIG